MNDTDRQELLAARARYAETLVPVALKGLRRMFAPDRCGFRSTLRLDHDGQLQAQGLSDRYAAMALIGLAARESRGAAVDLPLEPLWDRLTAWAAREARLGDAGLVLWGLCVRGDERAEEVAAGLSRRAKELFAQLPGRQSMSLGWLLAGIGQAMRKGLAGGLEDIARRACAGLLANRSPRTGLFCFGESRLRRNFLRARMNRRLGSFAAQVYPIVGLAAYAAASGSEEVLQAALGCADRICQLQGPEGQWWWIYDVRTGGVAVRYPVYAVHQDAMAPMALLWAARARGQPGRYASALNKGLDWLSRHPELPQAEMIDAERGVIWRAIQREDPARTGAFGLGRGDRLRMAASAWTGWEDRRSFTGGFRRNECRSYHLGWVLLAAALVEEALGERA